jgi:hypothetical protein
MSVTALKPRTTVSKTDAPFQAAMSELVANELIFAVVGPVGSGTSEIAEALEGLLAKFGYDPTILKAREVIEEWAAKKGTSSPEGAPSEWQHPRCGGCGS